MELAFIYQPARLRELNDMGVAQNLEVGFGKLTPERRDGGQRQDEVANRATANDQDLAAPRFHSANSFWEHVAPQNLVKPNITMKMLNARRMPHPTFTRFSLANPQSSRSRKRQGETVSQIPAITSR